MLYYQLVISFCLFDFFFPTRSNHVFTVYQSAMKSMVLYCNLRKFFDDTSSETKALKSKLETSKPKNSKLRETLV